MCVKAYLTPGDHVHVIEQVRTTVGVYVDPSPPTVVLVRASRSWGHYGVRLEAASRDDLQAREEECLGLVGCNRR